MNTIKLTKCESAIVHEFGDIYAEMHAKIRDMLESKTTEELHKIIDTFSKLNTTNCAWTAYEIRNTVMLDAKDILRDRENPIKS
jgi:hypothetical protein